jgi:hypothetical protein
MGFELSLDRTSAVELEKVVRASVNRQPKLVAIAFLPAIP